MKADRAKPKRSDALRNRMAILDAAAEVLRENPHASMAEIATRADVVRVTLYGHFESRAHLVDELFKREVADASRRLAEVDLEGDPVEALERLIGSSWRVVHNGRAILAVAEQELPAARIRNHNDVPLQRVRELIARGQRSGRFRRDLTAEWLTSMFFSTLHQAAAEIDAGRLDEEGAGDAVTRTLTSLLTAGADAK